MKDRVHETRNARRENFRTLISRMTLSDTRNDIIARLSQDRSRDKWNDKFRRRLGTRRARLLGKKSSRRKYRVIYISHASRMENVRNWRRVTPKLRHTSSCGTKIRNGGRKEKRKLASMISPVGTLLILSNRRAYVDALCRWHNGPPLANNRQQYAHVFPRKLAETIPAVTCSLLSNRDRFLPNHVWGTAPRPYWKQSASGAAKQPIANQDARETMFEFLAAFRGFCESID